MKDTYSIYYKSIVIILLLVLIVRPVKSQGIENVKIKFSTTKLSLKKALDELNALPEINIVYSNSEDYSKINIQFHSNTTTVKEAFKIIQEQAPIDIVLNNNHIIVKKRKLKESYQLKGAVKDAETNESLVAATILMPGTNRVFLTGNTGEFSKQLSPGQYTVIVKYLGYKDKQIGINLYNDTEISIGLEAAQLEIAMVNVTSQKKLYGDMETGRTIETIEAKQIGQLNVNNPSDILQGRINGVWATNTSGAPGDHQKVRIRGINSLFGSAEPLYIVDGVPVPTVNFRSLGIADLNIHDIESVTVLKDASSTALYGYLGANGVIIIDTKKGGGEKKINFQVKHGFQWMDKRYPLMGTKDFIATYQMSDTILGTHYVLKDPAEPKYKPRYPEYSNKLNDIDWQDEIFKNGKIKEVQLSGQGSFKTIDYYMSGNYFQHQGIIENVSYKKYSFTSNFSKVFKNKLSVHFNYKTSHQANNNNLDCYQGNSLIYRGVAAEPALKTTPTELKHLDGRTHLNENTPNNILSVSHLNTFFVILNYSRIQKANLNSANLLLKYPIFDNLYFNASTSIALRNYTFNTDIFSKVQQSIEKFTTVSQQYNLAYSKNLGNHEFKLTSGVKLYKDKGDWENDIIKTIITESGKANGSAEEIFPRESMSRYGESGSVGRITNSIIGNLSYNFNKKYFISLVANYDHLVEGRHVNVTNFFPSVALSWDMSREFGLNKMEKLDYFNVYANWGQSGNYPLNSLSNDLYNQNSYINSFDTTLKGLYVQSFANRQLKHEKTTEYNLGSEVSLFKNRVIFSVDYYFKTNSDLIMQRYIPYYYGGGFQYTNVGAMENEGLEYTIDLIPISTKNLTWHAKFGYSLNNQYIRKLNDSINLDFREADILYPDFEVKENEKIGAIYGYKLVGKWTEEDDRASNNMYAQYAGLKYVNNDTSNNSIDENDKTIIGNSTPDFTWNFYNSVTYKNFELTFLINAVIGVDKYNSTKAGTYIKGANREIRPIIAAGSTYHKSAVYYESSAFIEDASYVRLRSLTLTYSPTKKIFDEFFAKFSVSFENLVNLTKYSGYDPEATIYTGNNFSENAIDRGAFPLPRSMYFTIGLTF